MNYSDHICRSPQYTDMAPGDDDDDGGEEREEQGDAGTDYRSCVDSGDEEDKVTIAPCSLLATLPPPAAGGRCEGAGVPPRAGHVGGRQGGQGGARRGGGRHQLGLGGEAVRPVSDV